MAALAAKWDEGDFDAMLRELTAIGAALPFARETGGGLPYERTLVDEERLLYHAFVYLRYALSDRTPAEDRLDLAVRRVLEQPHRMLVPSERSVPVEQASRIGPRGLLRILQSPSDWVEAGPGFGGALAVALRGHLPERVIEERRRHTVDTAENRFVRGALALCWSIVERTRRHVTEEWTAPLQRARVLADCDRMAQRLDPLRAHRLWREVGPLVQLPAGSSVLQRRHGYREVLRHFVRLRLSSRLPFGDDAHAFRDLLALKDIATLYELWCYFAVARAVESHLGPPAEAARPVVREGQLTVPWSFRIAWPGLAELLYNPRYARGKARASTSLPLRPDIALVVSSGAGRSLHLFDAKFRLRTLGGFDQEDDETTTFQRTDLYKMHTYRDAIPAARSVRILYPGDKAVFYPADKITGDEWDGVGAVPAKPGESRVEEVVGSLLRGARPSIAPGGQAA